MRLTFAFLLISIAAFDAVPAAADCICRAQGKEFELGKTICLSTPKGPRLATCGMVLNNTSWHFSDTPCVVSAVEPPADLERAEAPAAPHVHAHAHGHGG